MVSSPKGTFDTPPSEPVPPATVRGSLRTVLSRSLGLAVLFLLMLSLVGPWVFSTWKYGPWALTAITTGLAALVLAIFHRAGCALTAYQQETALLKRQKKALADLLHTRTKDLVRANEHLQRQIVERKLQQAQKMEALGTLADGIAHDFNNILAAVMGYTQIALADLPADAPVQPYLKRVLEAGERAGALVTQILAFTRTSDNEPQSVSIHTIIAEVVQLMRASLPVTINLSQHLNSDATVMADPVQIHQLMMNLCANAGYAMREHGGTLTIALDDVVLDERFSNLHAGLINPGPHVHLAVSDTGPGIATEHLNRIFDPFFTTKPKREGTGMGLSMVHAIVSRLGGDISVQSAPGKGTRFDIYLPAAARAQGIKKRSAEELPKGT